MSGIKDLLILSHWMNNEQQDHLKASLLNIKKVPRERLIILNELAKERKTLVKKIDTTVIKSN